MLHQGTVKSFLRRVRGDLKKSFDFWVLETGAFWVRRKSDEKTFNWTFILGNCPNYE